MDWLRNVVVGCGLVVLELEEGDGAGRLHEREGRDARAKGPFEEDLGRVKLEIITC